MSQRDFQMHWKTKRLWIPVQTFTGILDAQAAIAGGAADMVSASGGGEIAVMAIAASADEVAHVMPIPWDMDRSKKVLARIYFIHNATTTTDAPIWKILSKFHVKQADIVAMTTSPDKTTTFATQTLSATSGGLEVTVWTDLSWDSYVTAADVLVGMMIECDDMGTASTNEIELIGIELMYEREAMDDGETPSTLNDLNNNPT